MSFERGLIYETGKGAKADLQKALKWYGLAASQGHQRAGMALERLEDASSLSQKRSGVPTSSSSSSAPPPAPASSSSGSSSSVQSLVAPSVQPPTPTVTTKPTPPPPPAASSSSSKPAATSSSGRRGLFSSTSSAPAAAAAAAASSSTAVVQKIPRPLSDGTPIPEIARGYEDVYRRFLGGKLIYRPNGDGDDRGMITLKIADLKNSLTGKSDPLEGTFDLSRCGDTGQYLSISTGYRKGKISANANKWEIWFTPWFMADKAVAQVPQNHYLRTVTTPDTWDPVRAPVGIFWTSGGWNDFASADYLTTQNMDALGSENLYKKWARASMDGRPFGGPRRGRAARGEEIFMSFSKLT